MSQQSVERAIGHLVTDARFRRRFAGDPAAALSELVAIGVDLNAVELSALSALDPERIEALASSVDLRILKADVLTGGIL